MTSNALTGRQILEQGPVVPVMVIDDLDTAVPLAKALVAGGIPVLEITLRTPVAIEAIRRISQEVEGAIVGAGTVLNPTQYADCLAAGARFVISPGLTPRLLANAQDAGIPLIPGIATISELMLGMDYGLDTFKFFPAEAAGGIPMLKAIQGPIPQVQFCPTGGITPSNYRDYLALKNVSCVGGSWLAPADKVKAGDFAAVTALARSAVEGV
jgi:2-dehydro-3-deoxyphosphogluconate aldolase / (4S)-4-hydroxy-2-oxoglutarate aldolase